MIVEESRQRFPESAIGGHLREHGDEFVGSEV
jgi:hypothetical protein